MRHQEMMGWTLIFGIALAIVVAYGCTSTLKDEVAQECVVVQLEVMCGATSAYGMLGRFMGSVNDATSKGNVTPGDNRRVRNLVEHAERMIERYTAGETTLDSVANVMDEIALLLVQLGVDLGAQ